MYSSLVHNTFFYYLLLSRVFIGFSNSVEQSTDSQIILEVRYVRIHIIKKKNATIKQSMKISHVIQTYTSLRSTCRYISIADYTSVLALFTPMGSSINTCNGSRIREGSICSVGYCAIKGLNAIPAFLLFLFQ